MELVVDLGIMPCREQMQINWSGTEQNYKVLTCEVWVHSSPVLCDIIWPQLFLLFKWLNGWYVKWFFQVLYFGGFVTLCSGEKSKEIIPDRRKQVTWDVSSWLVPCPLALCLFLFRHEVNNLSVLWYWDSWHARKNEMEAVGSNS